jgi:hypothetical protein
MIIPLFILSCSNANNRPNTSSSQKVRKTAYRIGGNSDKLCILFSDEANYARVKSNFFLTETEIIEVVDSLEITQGLVFFHLNEMTDRGEEYAQKSKYSIEIYKNPPKTKAEAVYQRKKIGIDGQIEVIETLYKNGINSSNYNSILNALSIISKDYRELDWKAGEAPEFKKKIQTIELSISKTQVKAYPVCRKAWAEEVRNKLWEHDIKVSYSGTAITLTGAYFASNANIKSTYEALSQKLYNLRFKRISFKWYEYDNAQYYTINSPKDNEVVK